MGSSNESGTYYYGNTGTQFFGSECFSMSGVNNKLYDNDETFYMDIMQINFMKYMEVYFQGILFCILIIIYTIQIFRETQA